MMQPRNLAQGDVVQLDPDPQVVTNPMFGGCMMVVTEPKEFGAQGYVQALGRNGEMGGQAFYRATWDEMQFVGCAAWVAAE